MSAGDTGTNITVTTGTGSTSTGTGTSSRCTTDDAGEAGTGNGTATGTNGITCRVLPREASLQAASTTGSLTSSPTGPSHKPDAATASGNNTFSVMTYNILAHIYIHGNEDWNSFRHCDSSDIEWDFRCPALIAEILHKRADIVCLQECCFEFRDGMWCLPTWLNALFDAGYNGLMQGLKQKDLERYAERNLKHVGEKVPIGVATFYLRDMFDLTAEEHGQGMGSMLVLQRKGRSAQELVAVCNVHLQGNPEKINEQLCQVKRAIKALRKHPHAAWMICGDYNNSLTKGYPLDLLLANEAHLTTLSDIDVDKTWCGQPGAPLLCDHIAFNITRLRPLAKTVASLTEEEVSRGLPCLKLNPPCPSDHIAVGGIFEFLPYTETVLPEPVAICEAVIGKRKQIAISEAMEPTKKAYTGIIKPTPLASQPKYKARSCQTHKRHLKDLARRRSEFAVPVDTLLLGDSLIEHLNGGFAGYRSGWEGCPADVFNAGVGGDRVENVLWRLQTSLEVFEPRPEVSESIELNTAYSNPCGLLSDLKALNVRQIILCVGTNNFALVPRATPENYINGMRELISICIQMQPRLERIAIMGLPCQQHLPYASIAAAYNQNLRVLCERLTEELATDERKLQVTIVFDSPVVLQPSDYVDDLHFNEQGYSKFIQAILQLYSWHR